jgi:hypothetical protein
MRKWIVALVVVVAVGAGGYYAWTRLHENISEQVRAGLDQWIKTLPPEYAVTYKTVDYNVASDTATLGGLTVKRTGDQPLDLAIDQVDVAKPSKDFSAAWAQAAANPATLAPDKAVPVAGTIQLKGATLHFGPASATMASAKLEGLRLYPWALLHQGVPSFAEVQANIAAKRSDPPKIDDLLPLLRFEASMMLGLGYDSYAAEDMQVSTTLPATAQMPATAVSYSIRKFSGSGFDRGSRGAGQLEGATIKAAPLGTITIERASIAGIEVQKPLTLLLSGAAPAPEMLDGLAIGDIKYDGMKLQTPDGKDVPVGTLEISKINFAKGVPVSGELAYAGLKLSKSLMPDPRAQAAFDQLGIDTMTLSLSLSYQWDVDQKHMALSNVSLKIDELGSLNLSTDLANMQPGADLEKQGSLSHALLRYDDASLLDRGLKAFALMSNADPAAIRQQVAAMVDMRATALGDAPAIKAAADAVKAFLADPHSLTIELAPQAPVAFTAFQGLGTMQPADIAALIGLKVTANK